MRRRLIVALVASGPMALAILACGSGGSGDDDDTPEGPAVEVDACTVQDAYSANEVSARAQYPEDQHVMVSGIVDSVAVSMGDNVIRPRPCMFSSVKLASGQEA